MLGTRLFDGCGVGWELQEMLLDAAAGTCKRALKSSRNGISVLGVGNNVGSKYPNEAEGVSCLS